ncbi:MAG: hypothetical protein N2Z22_11415, partial [Turneriella sp.]|nr:hypothetical protein [Turneriella sp.]
AARGAYDHNLNNGTPFYHIAGHTPHLLIDAIFPGRHDRVLAMHSTCSYRDVVAFTRCGGETVTTGIWPFRTTRHYTAYNGHHPHPRFSTGGVDVTHRDYPNRTEFANPAP